MLTSKDMEVRYNSIGDMFFQQCANVENKYNIAIHALYRLRNDFVISRSMCIDDLFKIVEQVLKDIDNVQRPDGFKK